MPHAETLSNDLDALIREIQAEADLHAETRNVLHGCVSTHPWCAGKTLVERTTTASLAIAGRLVPGPLRHRLEVLHKRACAYEFEVADNAWQTELLRAFGRAAGDARYDERGRGEDGSTLRAAYLARDAARQAWEAAR